MTLGASSSHRALRAGLIVGTGSCALVWACILLGLYHQRTQFDQVEFHLRVIAEFARQWPAFDLRDYQTATTPGYHILLATVWKFVTSDVAFLRLFAALATGAIGGLVAAAGARRHGVLGGICLALPVVCCPYIIQAGLHLVPDNSSWLLLVAALLVALRPRLTVGGMALGGVLLAMLVFTRQIHLWAAAPLWVAAWFAAPGSPQGAASGPDSAGLAGLLPGDGWRPGLRRAVVCGIFTAPAFVIVAGFVLLWGGLAPPAFRFQQTSDPDVFATNVTGFSPATPAFILCLLGVYSLPMLGLLWPALKSRAVLWLPVGLFAAGGVVLAFIPETTWLHRVRIGGLWNAVQWLDDHHIVLFGRTSPLIVVLAGLGGACVALWLQAVRRGADWVLAAALLGFVAACSCQALPWQRYFEPMVLVWLALCAANIRPGFPAPARGAFAGPMVLAAALLVVALRSMSS